MNKITVVGAGNVGATAAQRLAEKELAKYVVLIDVVEGVPQGKALDQWETAPIEGCDTRIIGTNGYGEAEGSELFIVTAGIARKPGMSREDLLNTNVNIVKSVAQEIKKCSPDAFVIVVSNPLDVMCYVMREVLGAPRHKVMGMAGVLDTARFRTFVAQELNVSMENVVAMVLGGHGDTMVPLTRLSSVSGIPLTELMSQETLDGIVKRTANGGAEIVGYLKTGSAYYAPAAATVEMVESILKDKKKVLPCAAFLEGEYGVKGLFVGVPVKLGARGIEKIYELKLTADETAMLKKSTVAVEELVGIIKQKMG